MMPNVILCFDRDHLTDAIGPHADAVNALCNLNRPAIMGDHYELSALAQFGQYFAETIDVGFVEHRINLIENAERSRRDFQKGKDQGRLTDDFARLMSDQADQFKAVMDTWTRLLKKDE